MAQKKERPGFSGLAREFYDNQATPEGPRLRYWHGAFWYWQDGCWREEADRDRTSDRIRTWSVRHGWDLGDPQVASIRSHVRSLARAPGDMPAYVEPSGAVTPRPDWIACRSGILDLEPCLREKPPKLHPLSLRWWDCVRLPVEYQPGAICSRWLGYLDRVMEADPERISLLQEWMGYHLIRRCKPPAFMILDGSGENGKSVYSDVLKGLLGSENVAHLALDALGGKHDSAGLVGKLANFCGEVGVLDRSNESMMKTLVSGEGYQANPKYKQTFPAVSHAKITMMANNRPRWRDSSWGLWRRELIVPFRIQISREERDLNLAEKICSEELAGVLNWAIEGLQRLLIQGQFTESHLGIRARDEHWLEVDPSRAFLLEECTLDPEAEVSCQDLYHAARQWAQDRGYKGFGESLFGKAVRETYPAGEVTRKRGRRDAQGFRTWNYCGLRCPAADYTRLSQI